MNRKQAKGETARAPDATATGRPIAKDLLVWLRCRQPEMLKLLAQFVRCESPSGDKAAVDRFGEIVAREWRKRGAKVRILRQRRRGNHVRAELFLPLRGGDAGPGRLGPRAQRDQILVLGHLDTVYPLGTLRHMPFRARGGRAYGPGAFDMKAGLVLALFAVDALRAARIAPCRLVFFWNSDEEIGSGTSRAWIEREARRSRAVLVLEPALGVEGRLKTRRKGVFTAEIEVRGRAAHAGINPERGVNAVHELALQIARLAKWSDPPGRAGPRRGIVVQANVIAGGSAANVVAERARAQVDVRYWHMADAERILRKLRGLRPILPGARLSVRIGAIRPPLEQTPESARLFALARRLGRETGLDLAEAASGGGSDGNFAAAAGAPVLDGLGAAGDAAHTPAEHILLRSLPARAALLAALLAAI